MDVRVLGRWALACSMTVGLLGGCGGGGGGGGDGTLPEVSQDINPPGTRIDVSSRNLIPLQVGNRWTYDYVQGGNIVSTLTVRVASENAGTFVVTETGNPDPADDESNSYRLTADGLVLLDPLDAVSELPGAYALLPQVLEIATPFYPVGGQRRVIRQGSTGVDLDGDGRHESFRLEYTQVFLGFENVDVAGQPREAARLRTDALFSVYTTRDGQTVTANGVEHAWLADDLGYVRFDRQYSGAVVDSYSLRLRSARIDGAEVPL